MLAGLQRLHEFDWADAEIFVKSRLDFACLDLLKLSAAYEQSLRSIFEMG